MDWQKRLVELHIPVDLSIRMAPYYQSTGIDPESVKSIYDVRYIGEAYGFQTTDWWALLSSIMPGIIITAIGTAITYALKNIEIKGFPMSIIGVVPIGIGLYLVYTALTKK
jgi:hypothetical protein